MDFEARYGERTPRSHELFERASRIIPAGAGSSARTFKFGWNPYPPFMAEGTGSRMPTSTATSTSTTCSAWGR